MNNKYRVNTLIIVLISIVISAIGIGVQMEWGKALFPENVHDELIENILLVIQGIILCGILVMVANHFGSNLATMIIFIWTLLLLILSCTPLAQITYGVRLLRFGSIIVRFSLLLPLAFIMAVSRIVDSFGKTDEKMMLIIVIVLVELILFSEWIFGSSSYLWYTLPWIAYFLMFPTMKKHKWYYAIPAVFLLIYLGRIIRVSFLPESDILSFRDRTIAGWLHPNSETYAGTNYFMNEIRAMIRSGRLFGNSSALAADKFSYQDGTGLTLVGLYQRYGLVGFISTLLLYLEMCRRIFLNGTALARTGNHYYGTLCNGIGLYMLLSAVLSTLSEFYILPFNILFDLPFLCVSGFQPMWYLYLAIVLIVLEKPERNIVPDKTI